MKSTTCSICGEKKTTETMDEMLAWIRTHSEAHRVKGEKQTTPPKGCC